MKFTNEKSFAVFVPGFGNVEPGETVGDTPKKSTSKKSASKVADTEENDS